MSFWEQWCTMSQTCPADWHPSKPLRTLESSYSHLRNVNEWQDEVQNLWSVIADSPQVSYITSSSSPLFKPILFLFFFFFWLVMLLCIYLLGTEHILNGRLCVESCTYTVSTLQTHQGRWCSSPWMRKRRLFCMCQDLTQARLPHNASQRPIPSVNSSRITLCT